MAHLIVEKGENRGTTKELPENGEVIVGRSERADIHLDERIVSREHFSIVGRDGTFYVRDLKSGNGTFLNGVAVDCRELKNGDQISAGETFFSFITESSRQFRQGLIGESIAGHEILERIGGGGMGTVYRARQISLDRIVAFKVLASDLVEDKTFVERFLREARSAAKLNHPNVTQVYDVGCEENIYYISMELARGGSIQDLLSRKQVIEPYRAARMIQDAARALKFAEQKQLIHRDIKPSNLMLTDHDSVKLIDLGIAKQVKSPSDIGDRKIIGTPDYMAPEQATDEEVDYRADLYALGSTFYHMVTGRRTHRGETLKQIIKKKVNKLPEPPSKVNSDVPSWMSDLILDLTEPEPEDRPVSGDEVVQRIERNLSRDDSEDASEPDRIRIIRRARNHPIKLVTGLAALFLLTVGLYVALGFATNRTETGDKSVADEQPLKEKSENAEQSPDATTNENEQQLAKKTPLLNRADNAYDDAMTSTTLESVSDAIEAHRIFLETFPDAESSSRIRKQLSRLSSKREEIYLESDRKEIRREIHHLKKDIRSRKLTSLKKIESARKAIQSGTRNITQRFKRLSNIYPPYLHDQIQQIREVELTSWALRMRSALYTFEQGLGTIRKYLSRNNFAQARKQVQKLKQKNLLDGAPFSTSLSALSGKIQNRERSLVRSRRKQIKKAISEHRFDHARSLYSRTLKKIDSGKLKKEFKNVRDLIEKRQKAYVKSQRRQKAKEERERLSRKSAEFFLDAEQRSPELNASYFDNMPEMDLKKHRRYLSFLRFLARQHSRFFTTLKEADSFESRSIQHNDLGKLTLKDAGKQKAKLSPSPDVAFRKKWSSLKIDVLLKLMQRNKQQLTSDQMLSLCAMYFLYGHRNQGYYSNAVRTLNDAVRHKQLERSFINVLCKMFFLCNRYIQLRDVEPLEGVNNYRNYLSRNDRSFKNFIAESLRKKVRKLTENGKDEKARPYLKLLKSRYGETTSYKKHKLDLLQRIGWTKNQEKTSSSQEENASQNMNE